MPRATKLQIAMALSTMTLAVYFRAIGAEFVRWDENVIASARVLLAQMWTARSSHNSAVMLLREGLVVFPESINLHRQLGVSLFEGQRHVEASQQFSEMLLRHPDHCAALS